MVNADNHKINQSATNNATKTATTQNSKEINERTIWIDQNRDWLYVNGGVNQNRLQTRTASYHVPQITQAFPATGKRDHRKRCGFKSWLWTWKNLKRLSRYTLMRSEGHSIYERNTWSVQYKQNACNATFSLSFIDSPKPTISKFWTLWFTLQSRVFNGKIAPES